MSAMRRGESDALFARPLLDRLMLGEEGHEASARVPLREHLEIIRRDVELLLGSRSPLPMQVAADGTEPLSVTEYGLPDFTHLSARSEDDCRLLAKAVKRVIEAFESRLCAVEVQALAGGSFSATLAITARLAGHDGTEFTMRHRIILGG